MAMAMTTDAIAASSRMRDGCVSRLTRWERHDFPEAGSASLARALVARSLLVQEEGRVAYSSCRKAEGAAHAHSKTVRCR